MSSSIDIPGLIFLFELSFFSGLISGFLGVGVPLKLGRKDIVILGPSVIAFLLVFLSVIGFFLSYPIYSMILIFLITPYFTPVTIISVFFGGIVASRIFDDNSIQDSIDSNIN